MSVHGTFSSYSRGGCRCEACTEANRVQCSRAVIRLEARGRADPSLIPHGTDGGYKNWGCRCDDCTDEHVAALADWKRRRKAGTR